MIKDLDGEIWKWVIEYKGLYQVSNMGRIKSVNRIVTSDTGIVYNLKEKLRSLPDSGQGYLVVELSKEGIKKQFRVNILVAKSFHVNANNHPIVLHLNDIKSDNRAINLKWGTYQENTIHRYKVFGYKPNMRAKSKKSVSIKVTCPNGKMKIIKGIKTVSDLFGFPTASIGRHLKNNTAYKKHYFAYVNLKQTA